MKEFLSKIKKPGYLVAHSSDFFTTKSGSGINFRVKSLGSSYAHTNIYYHSPKNPQITQGDYIICYRASNFVSDRLDAFAIIETGEFKNKLATEIFEPKWKHTLLHLASNSPRVNDILLAQHYNTLFEALEWESLTSELRLRLSEHSASLHLGETDIAAKILRGEYTNTREILENVTDIPISKLIDYLETTENDKSGPNRSAIVLYLLNEVAEKAKTGDVTPSKLKAIFKQNIVEKVFKQEVLSNAVLSSNLINLAFEYGVHVDFAKEVVESWLCDFKDPSSSALIARLSETNLEQSITERVLNAIGSDYDIFLENLSHLDTGTIVNQFSLDDFPLYANFAVEEQFIRYLSAENRTLTFEQTRHLKQLTQNKQFYEAKLLISVFELKLDQRTVGSSQIVTLLGSFQTELFERHAESRTKIDLKVIPPCSKSSTRFHNQSSMTTCEGKVIPSKANEQGGDDYYVLCKRAPCKDSEICTLKTESYNFAKPHVEYPFYKLLSALLNISPRTLHSDDQFVRILSALNRWNVILERLICRCCQSPLAISEHSRDSMGKMAVGTTYWHCANETCQQYSESIKISYCIGCQKVIDSRVDTRSCTPYNIRSYEKFYICSTCSSCCSRHNGNAGICHSCGIENAYSSVTNENRTRAVCRACQAPVSISPFGFKAIQQHKANGGVFREIKSISEGKCHLIAAVPNDETSVSKVFIKTMPWDTPVLYVFDLLECLRAGYIEPKMLAKYDKVYDLKVIEKMAGLGLQHRKYGNEVSVTALTKRLQCCVSGEDDDTLLSSVIDLIHRYFKRFNEQSLWAHYENVEYPFILALHNLLAGGFSIDKAYIEQEIKNLETDRNRSMQQLLSLNIYHPDKTSVSSYLFEKFNYADAKGLIQLFERKGAKSLREKDTAFDYLHQIDKAERAANVSVKLLGQPNRIVPVYDPMGTVTGRCTSKSPNLMNLPRESRHIIRPEAGMQIVECDYKQMEVGVLAGISNDQQLIADFNSGDVYQRFANAVEIDRDQAKTLVLGILYGMSSATIGTLLDVSEASAQSLLDRFLERYKGVQDYQTETAKEASDKGYLTSVSGLRRFVNNKVNKTDAIRSWEANWFKNFPVQSSAATIFKQAIIELAKNLAGSQFKLIVPHYDAIVFQAPIGQLDYYGDQVKAAMFRAMKKQFPDLNPEIDVKSNQEIGWGAKRRSS
ncbi:DNA polymerase [Vibrio breoganii]|uniref:DNA polymerase n=1 Tax=Vibrio breoganii TaxID=553239 RepID=UPI000C83DBF4|nr:DNA polymerase [Vibrio breoganii]PMG07564.1 hypothetical protein BCV00_07570 [Vibrio breoganii]PMJ45320.1 hypothetical protein BCU21_13660 [Vibrio breoganii]PMK59434.1 hypothetical protein BCT97_06500 [Vibrio breoganii]PMM79088.1 hypothetical protein BCT45_17075 [Vibrio breoganii]PMO29233.1 hypothetical protein BCT14_06675 [Vibrio breoganii]